MIDYFYPEQTTLRIEVQIYHKPYFMWRTKKRLCNRPVRYSVIQIYIRRIYIR